MHGVPPCSHASGMAKQQGDAGSPTSRPGGTVSLPPWGRDKFCGAKPGLGSHGAAARSSFSEQLTAKAPLPFQGRGRGLVALSGLGQAQRRLLHSKGDAAGSAAAPVC